MILYKTCTWMKFWINFCAQVQQLLNKYHLVISVHFCDITVLIIFGWMQKRKRVTKTLLIAHFYLTCHEQGSRDMSCLPRSKLPSFYFFPLGGVALELSKRRLPSIRRGCPPGLGVLFLKKAPRYRLHDGGVGLWWCGGGGRHYLGEVSQV